MILGGLDAEGVEEVVRCGVARPTADHAGLGHPVEEMLHLFCIHIHIDQIGARAAIEDADVLGGGRLK